jgi:hypothetical protein
VLAAVLILHAGRYTNSLYDFQILLTFIGQLDCHSRVNMAALLSICTTEEKDAVTQFLWVECVSGAELHLRLSAQYGNSFTAIKCV